MSKSIEKVRNEYPNGTRVRLINMVGESIPKGTEGTVVYVDDIGQIGVEWDNGSSLALIPGEDSFVKL